MQPENKILTGWAQAEKARMRRSGEWGHVQASRQSQSRVLETERRPRTSVAAVADAAAAVAVSLARPGQTADG